MRPLMSPKTERKCIGLIGGLSWESTNVYYQLLNQFSKNPHDAWRQPHVIIDSLDFAEIVYHQQREDWAATGEILAISAARLESCGATVIGIAANTMHINAPEVTRSISVPLIDIRDSILRAVKAKGAQSVSLLGTKYLLQADFYSSYIELAGVRVIKPTNAETDELQRIIFDELTQGIVLASSRERLIDIAQKCQSRGGEIVALACTEFELLLNEGNSPFPLVDSTTEHVHDLLGL